MIEQFLTGWGLTGATLAALYFVVWLWKRTSEPYIAEFHFDGTWSVKFNGDELVEAEGKPQVYYRDGTYDVRSNTKKRFATYEEVVELVRMHKVHDSIKIVKNTRRVVE